MQHYKPQIFVLSEPRQASFLKSLWVAAFLLFISQVRDIFQANFWIFIDAKRKRNSRSRDDSLSFEVWAKGSFPPMAKSNGQSKQQRDFVAIWNGCWLFSNSTLSRYNSTQTSCKFSLNKGYISWKKSTWPGCTISKAERTWNEGRLILLEDEIHLCTPTGNRKKEASSDERLDRLTMNSNGNFTTKQGKNLELTLLCLKKHNIFSSL